MDFLNLSDINDLEPISKQELDKLFIRVKNGDISAKNEIAKHNIKLINFLIYTKFSSHVNKEELFEIGMIALTKAINTYDINQKLSFTTYCSTCIHNEILNFFRDNRKKIITVSLNEPIARLKNDNVLVLENILNNNIDLSSEYEDKELYEFINSKLDVLKEKEKIALKMRFGYNNKKEATFNEIAIYLGCSRQAAAKLVEKGLEKIKKELLKDSYFETNVKKNVKIKNINKFDKF